MGMALLGICDLTPNVFRFDQKHITVYQRPVTIGIRTNSLYIPPTCPKACCDQSVSTCCLLWFCLYASPVSPGVLLPPVGLVPPWVGVAHKMPKTCPKLFLHIFALDFVRWWCQTAGFGPPDDLEPFPRTVLDTVQLR